MSEPTSGALHIRDELFAARKGSEPLAPRSFESATTLQSLECVRRQTQVEEPSHDDVLEAALEIVRRAVALLPYNRGRNLREAISAILGIPQSAADKSMTGRYAIAAELLSENESTVRDKEKNYLLELAEKILAIDRSDRMLESIRRSGTNETQQPRIVIDWLARFEDYYRISTPVSRLRADLIAAGELRRDIPRKFTYADRLHGALFGFIEFEVKVRRFIDAKGGLWVLRDSSADQVLAEAVYEIEFLSPLSIRERSFLIKLRDEVVYEDDFLTALESTERGADLLRRWEEWERGCLCGDEEAAECEVHQMINAAWRYMVTIDEGWYEIADWYKVPPTELSFDNAYYYRRHQSIDE